MTTNFLPTSHLSNLRNRKITAGNAITLSLALVSTSIPLVVKTKTHFDLKPAPRKTRKLQNPTLIIPGITDLGKKVVPLRNHLKDNFIAAHIWGSKRNNGPTRNGVPKLKNVFNKFYESSGEPVVLIGHSFGGLMSLFLARLYPEKVKAVILLASPCQLGFNDIATNTGFGNLFKFIQAGKKLFDQDVLRNWVGEQDRIPVLDVPIISFVSCDDKNVNGFSCESPIGPLNRTIYINTNHSGVKNHPATKAALVFLY
nr:alpha/beta fold hydrolase [Acidimicrobiia bacterium]